MPPEAPPQGVLAIRRISQCALAARVGVTERWLGGVVNGYSRPSPALVQAIADVLDADPAESSRVDQGLHKR